MKLEQSRKKQAAVTKNLHIAALKDILTNANNRIKFIDDFGKNDSGQNKIDDCPNSPYCFVMFNLAGFGSINLRYGHDIGDAALASTADILKEHFGAQNIYRTGSDEFVAVAKCTTNDAEPVMTEVNTVLAELRRPRRLGGETVSIPYTAAVAKKGISITPEVLISLKEMLRRGGSVENQAVYTDLDSKLR